MQPYIQDEIRDSLDAFKQHLIEQNISLSTTISYTNLVTVYFKKHRTIDKINLLIYKSEMVDRYKPKTVNLGIQAINKYLDFIGKSNLRLKGVKLQLKTFVDNVISMPDYTFLKEKLKEDKEDLWYFLVRFMGATGARVSEVVKFKVEHIHVGYFDVYGKGGKVRRLFIPIALRREAEDWINRIGLKSGYLFLDKTGKIIKTSNIRHHLKVFAKRYGIRPDVMYPYSFRHRYAKSFLESYNDLALLADLMGHVSIETTRMYLRRSSSEQQAIVDEYITW